MIVGCYKSRNQFGDKVTHERHVSIYDDGVQFSEKMVNGALIHWFQTKNRLLSNISWLPAFVVIS